MSGGSPTAVASCSSQLLPDREFETHTMTMTVQLTDTQMVLGTFTLMRGSPGRVLKCLLPLAWN